MKIKNILNAGMIAVCAAAVAAPLTGCSKSNTTTEQTTDKTPTEQTDAKGLVDGLFTPANLEEGKTYPLIVVTGDNADATAAVFTAEDVQAATPAYVYTGSDVASIIGANAVDSKRVYSVGETPTTDVYAASVIIDGTTPEQLKDRNYTFFFTSEEPVKALTESLEKAGVSYTTAEIPADQTTAAQRSAVTGVMLEKGQPVNIFYFATGSNATAAEIAAIPAVQSWLLSK